MIVEFSAPLRRFVNDEEKVTLEASSLLQAFNELTTTYPDLNGNVFTQEGELMSFVTLFIDNRNILDPMKDMQVSDDSIVSFVSSIAGG